MKKLLIIFSFFSVLPVPAQEPFEIRHLLRPTERSFVSTMWINCESPLQFTYLRDTSKTLNFKIEGGEISSIQSRNKVTVIPHEKVIHLEAYDNEILLRRFEFHATNVRQPSALFYNAYLRKKYKEEIPKTDLKGVKFLLYFNAPDIKKDIIRLPKYSCLAYEVIVIHDHREVGRFKDFKSLFENRYKFKGEGYEVYIKISKYKVTYPNGKVEINSTTFFSNKIKLI